MPPVSIEQRLVMPSELPSIESSTSTPGAEVATAARDYARESSSLFILDAFFEYERGNTNCLYHIYQTLAALSRHAATTPMYGGSKALSLSVINASMVETITMWLKTLSASHITRFNKSYKEFIDRILAIDWTVLNDAFVKSYIDFICNLVSAHPFYILPCLRMLVASFEHRCLEELPEAVVAVAPAQLSLAMVCDRVHGCLSMLFRLVPASSGFLIPLLSEYYPHKRASKLVQVAFLSNLLRLAKEFPSLRASILEIAIGRIIQIDVEIQVEVDELEEDELEIVQSEVLMTTDFDEELSHGDDSDTDVHDVDDVDDADNVDDVDVDTDIDVDTDADVDADDRIHSPNPKRASMALLRPNGERQAETNFGAGFASEDEDAYALEDASCAAVVESESVAHIKEEIDKLDAVLLLVFQFIQDMHAQSQLSKEGLAQFQSCFLELLCVFEKIVLPTLKSRYTQFIMFYMSSLSDVFPDHFLGLLAGRLFGESPELMLKGRMAGLQSQSRSISPNPLGFDSVRLISASYIGSYVARAKFLDASTVRACLELLLGWCDHYITYYSHSSQLSSPSWGSSHAYKHAVFYAVAQSIFYIFCFRHIEVLDPGLFVYTDKLRGSFERLVYCRLNPLMNTSPTIAREFARTSARSELVYCLHLFNGPRGRSSSLPASRTGSPLAAAITPTPPSFLAMAVPDSGRSTPLSSMLPEVTELAEFDNFFPFDPYKLKSSCSFIGEAIFTEWSDDSPADMDTDEA